MVNQPTSPIPMGFNIGVGPKITPTVGRIVYYKAYGTPGGEFPAGVDRVAIITQINDDENVGLCIINPTGLFFNTHVARGNQPGNWDWMPFQKASASNSQSAEPRPETLPDEATK